MKTTKVFTRILENAIKRIQILQGGTSSSKTYSILQYLYEIAKQSETKLLISVVSESMPHLRRGAIKDFFDIVGEEYLESNHNKTNNSYIVNNCTIEFFSVEDASKVRGARRDILFINECNNVRKSTYDQLSVRTKYKIFLDFNPVCDFWGHELADDDRASFDISTYKDNCCLHLNIIADIESRKDKDPNWWRVYGMGLVGQLEGLIFPNFEIIDAMPDYPFLMGLDFGFTNDPTALVKTMRDQNNIYIDEMLYKTGLTIRTNAKQPGKSLEEKFPALGVRKVDCITADCAEPKSIAALDGLGYTVLPCSKGKDSIIHGIDYIKSYNINITRRSTNLIKETRNYSNKFDKNTEKYTNVPEDKWNHGWDAVRYSEDEYISPKLGEAHRVRM